MPSDTFRFLQPLTGYRVTEISERHAVYSGRDYAGMPSRIRTTLHGAGFESYFPLGIEVRLTSFLSPFLSWDVGTVDSGHPSAPSRWIMVSFQDRQAPVLFTFESPVQMIVTGKAGDWRLRTTTRYIGWVKISLPRGQNAMPNTGVAGLGETCQKIAKDAVFWGNLTPKLVSFEIRSNETSVTGVWTFSAPGAQIPPAAMLAKTGGYPIKILTGIRDAAADHLDGPTAFTTEPKLAIEFPLRRIGAGRGIAVGPIPSDLIGTASPYDIPSIAELALTNMMASRDRLVREAAEGALGDYVVSSTHFVEPVTGQRLPYDSGGDGIDLAAAHGLLMQSTLAGAGADSEPNSLFTSVQWRQDWRTWRLICRDVKKADRAAALMAVTGALSPESERRLSGAMFQAGIAYAKALPTFRSRRKYPAADLPVVEPLGPLRASLYSREALPDSDFVASLSGGLRVMSDDSIRAEATEAGWRLTLSPSNAPTETLTIAAAWPVALGEIRNVAGHEIKDLLGVYQIRFRRTEPSEASLEVLRPAWNPTLPKILAPPRYSE